MVKYVVLGVMVAVIAFVSYRSLQREPAETHLLSKQKMESVEAATETSKPVTKPASKVEKPEVVLDVPEKKIPVAKSEVNIDALHAEEPEGVDDEDMEEEDEIPTVKRSQLIGGADVEWIEPKPREDGDVFGKPPGW
jgi:hypothetical protein